MFPDVSAAFVFGPYRLVPSERLLLRNGVPVQLPPKAFEVLSVLVRNAGQLTAKSQLMREVWPDTFVEEVNIAQNVALLRKTLGGSEAGTVYIETVPKHGYRFMANVERIGAEPLLPDSIASQDPPVSNVALGVPIRTDTRRRWAMALSAFVAIPMVVLALWQYYPGFRRSAGPEIRHIAVLPFVNLSADPAQEYFADGLTDEIITMLGRVDGLLPIARASAFRLKGQPVDVREIGKKLNVDVVLEGSVRTAGDRVRITAHLSDARSGRQIWSEAYEEQLKDTFSIQKNVALSVIERLRLSAPVQPEKASVRHPGDLETYNLYLRGRFFWNQRTEQGVRMAITNFEQAIARDPAYAAAYSGLADAYGISQNYAFRNPREIWPKALTAAEKAVQLDPDSAEAHTSLGHVLAFYRHDWQNAKLAFERAIGLNPGYSTAHQWYASMYLMPFGRLQEAEAEMRLAARLDPLSPITQQTLGTTLYFQGNHDAAVEQYKAALQLEPKLCRPHAYLSEVYYRKLMPEPAEQWALRGLEICGHDPMMVAWASHVYGGLEKRQKASELLRKLEQMSHAHVSPFLLAIVHLGLKDTDAAFEHLSRAVEEPNIWMAYLSTNPMFAPYRDDPRFKELVRRMRLEQAIRSPNSPN